MRLLEQNCTCPLFFLAVILIVGNTLIPGKGDNRHQHGGGVIMGIM